VSQFGNRFEVIGTGTFTPLLVIIKDFYIFMRLLVHMQTCERVETLINYFGTKWPLIQIKSQVKSEINLFFNKKKFNTCLVLK